MARRKIRDVIASTNWYVILLLTQAMLIARCCQVRINWSCIIVLIPAILNESKTSTVTLYKLLIGILVLSSCRTQKIVLDHFTSL